VCVAGALLQWNQQQQIAIFRNSKEIKEKNMNLEKRLDKAIKECDKSKNYKGLQAAFRQHVFSICVEICQKPLVRPVEDTLSPAASSPEASLIRDYFNALEKNDDLWLLVLQNAPLLLAGSKRRRDEQLDLNTAVHAFVLLYGRGLPASKSIQCRWDFLNKEKDTLEKSPEYLNRNAAERRKVQLDSVLAVFSEKAHRHYFSAFWTKFLNAGCPASLHLHLLNRLPVDIMPHLTNPIVVADYLSACFSCGGLIAVLALKGMFLLMLDHGVEQPKFYEQLYSLLTPDAFSSRHRYELFELVDLCLKSLRVPSYIAAAFAKKVVQIALLSPAPTLYFSLPFLRQLLQRHPNCLSLIHRSNVTSMLDDDAKADNEKTRADAMVFQLFEGVDPFQAEETNPWKSNAIYSSLWEFVLLEKHFLPAVPLMVSAFSSTAEDNTPLRFEKTYGRLFTAEATREVSKGRVPAVAYAAPEYDANSPSNVFTV
jgi:U3 small nucleolar RNA-associated protein 19